jgi:hypothetical protein
VQLPPFVTLTGTLGDFKSEINKLVIGGLLARSLSGIAPIGDKAGTILQGVGGLLSGQAGGTAKTNASGTVNTNTAAGLLDSLLNQPKKDRAATNAPAASTNKPAKPGLSDLLKLIPEKK